MGVRRNINSYQAMIYIKRKSTSLLLALASLSVVSSSLMSCSENEGLSSVTLSDKKISFTTTEIDDWTSNSGSSNDENSRAISTIEDYHPLIVKSDLGKPLYLHPVEQVGTYFYNDKDELVTRSGVPLSKINNVNSISTRGTKVTSISNEIFISSVFKKDNVEAEFFPFEKATRSGNTWHTSNDKYWPTDATLSFYAYAPTNASMLSESGSGLSKDRTVLYVAGTGEDIKSQPDFIVAKSENNSRSATEAASAVDLQFSHALTAITFSVGNDMVLGTVKSVAIRNVRGKGDYNISTGRWTLSSDLSDYEIPLGTDGNGIDIETGVAKALTTDPLTLMMIPQKFDANSTTKVEIVFNNGVSDRTLSAELKGTEWQAGHTINYKLSASAITTLNLGDVTFPTSWSNSINATATNKLKSAYANGDKIGLFVVDENKKVKNANIAITYNGSAWTLPSGETYKFSPQYTYFAYYPYQSSFTGLPAVNATVDVSDATTFFSSAISTWKNSKLVSDQSTLAKLNACDLHIGKATFDNTASKINFTNMAHAMGLADITLESKILPHLYKLSTDQSYTWTNGSTAVTASNSLTNSRKFYDVTSTRGVMIVPPATTTSFNSTSTGNDAWSEAVSITAAANDIDAGTAKLNPYIDKGTYAMALGDIYYSDGALSHQSDALLSDKTPIGVIAYIAQGNDDYWVEKNTVKDGIGGHALVMCLRTIGSVGAYTDALKDYQANGNNGTVCKAYIGQGYKWRNTNTNSGQTQIHDAGLIRGSGNQIYGSGYTLSKKYWDLNDYPAFQQVKKYNTLPANSDKCTGWFMPSAGQYYALIKGLGADTNTSWNIQGFLTNGPKDTENINKALRKVGDDKYTEFFGKINTWQMSSTEAWDVSFLLIDSGVDDIKVSGSIRFTTKNSTPSACNKNDGTAVLRPFLAF